jgi:hypothetical protein
MKILAIDPGTKSSAYVIYDTSNNKILCFNKADNDRLLNLTNTLPDIVLIEMVACYGMPVGKEVFDTAVWVGRYMQAFHLANPILIYRKDVKLHHCNTMRAKDGNIIQALKDKYGDKGTKKNPGFFYGFSADVWQAFAIASYWAETNKIK